MHFSERVNGHMHSVMDHAEPVELKPLCGECGGLAIINFKISGEQGT